ncbi:DUF2399 domain-containing protein [Cohnella algarum]|nr:DUF2399 domain-containing protein [Cohnella algarum]
MDADDGSQTLKLRELYRSFGILDDDLSSIVYWYFSDWRESAIPTVWTLRQVDSEKRIPACLRIYVVENPAVFSTILDSLNSCANEGGEPAALLCTSGPASAAAIRWIQRCLDISGGDCRIYYYGDFDVKGLVMGQTLYRLFPGRFVPWRFDAKTYREADEKCLLGLSFESAELDKLWEDGDALGQAIMRHDAPDRKKSSPGIARLEIG